MKKVVTKLALMSVVGMAVIALMTCLTVEPAQARVKYSTAFKAAYPELKGVTCFTCHDKDPESPTSRKLRNAYGVALEHALGKKNVLDVEVIKTALTKAEAEKSPDNGKTFGDIIKAGKLPATK
ncbi:MAG: hypothetical protein HY000_39495 [Planctomycetes bacterium]|nr:hypothetical protein [Planctomycetota bacterium]